MRKFTFIICHFIPIIIVVTISCNRPENQSDPSTTKAQEKSSKALESGKEKEMNIAQPGETVTTPVAAEVHADTILGSWIRPDGNYILELTKINEDNLLEAVYYNPRPIRVSLAQIKKENPLRIYVEFDDVNYRGSYYDLQYDPVNDALTGNYYQATYGQTYSIAFIRNKPTN